MIESDTRIVATARMVGEICSRRPVNICQGSVFCEAEPTNSTTTTSSNEVMKAKRPPEITPGKINGICREAARSEHVHLVIKLLNGYDVLLGVHCTTPEELYRFIRDELARIEGINQIETLVRAEVRKRLVSILR